MWSFVLGLIAGAGIIFTVVGITAVVTAKKVKEQREKEEFEKVSTTVGEITEVLNEEKETENNA